LKLNRRQEENSVNASDSRRSTLARTLPTSAANASSLLPAVLVPRLLRIQDAARYLSATTWFVETLIREKKILSLIVGKRRVIDVLDLDAWIENEKMKSVAKSGVDVAA
jgi:excisionase family DNA binding protein